MTQDLSTFRLALMRLMFFATAVGLGVPVWTKIVSRAADWDALQGIAYSFWGALSLLAIIGLRFPERMLPLLLLQLTYKLIWLAAIVYPHWSEHALDDPTARDVMRGCTVGAVADLLVIPWPHVFKRYVRGLST